MRMNEVVTSTGLCAGQTTIMSHLNLEDFAV